MDDTTPTLIHHGGAEGVTGSCHQLYADPDHSLLIDCGLFQGEDAGADTLAQHRVDFDVQSIQALVLTHVHIDHVGRLPYLLAAGYRGPILCTKPSAHLLPLVIDDALRIGFTRDARLIERFQQQLQDQLVPLKYGHWHPVTDHRHLSQKVRLEPAGHILGSAYVKVATRYKPTGRRHRTVFSGDLGTPGAPLLPAPQSPHHADLLVLEATYGDRTHEHRDQRRQRLSQAIEHAVQDGGTVIIPAFSIGRTQELLYELEALTHNARGPWRQLRIIVDSPLAARFNRVYRRLKPYWDQEARKRAEKGRHPLNFNRLHTVDSHDQHQRTVATLAQGGQPAVLIAASGMCAGGRVVNYLKAMLGDPRHHVLFVGYQAEGTPGRDIQRHGPNGGWVELEGERYDIRAGVTTIGGYSAHADQQDLLRFVRQMKRPPKTIKLVHGAPSARTQLAQTLTKQGYPTTP